MEDICWNINSIVNSRLWNTRWLFSSKYWVKLLISINQWLVFKRFHFKVIWFFKISHFGTINWNLYNIIRLMFLYFLQLTIIFNTLAAACHWWSYYNVQTSNCVLLCLAAPIVDHYYRAIWPPTTINLYFFNGYIFHGATANYLKIASWRRGNLNEK